MNPKWALEVKRLGANVSSSFSGDLTDAPARDILGRYALPRRDLTDRTVADRLLLPMLLEALAR